MVGNLELFLGGNPLLMHCSNCGFKGGKKQLNVSLRDMKREWTCLNCGASHDRDVNAAVNILEIVQPKTKVETKATENSVQLSLFALSRRGALVDYLSDTEEAWLLASQHFPVMCQPTLSHLFSSVLFE